jgi:hypothetical protein
LLRLLREKHVARATVEDITAVFKRSPEMEDRALRRHLKCENSYATPKSTPLGFMAL